MNETDYKKIIYILTPPKGNRYLRMTRPIEKVKRGVGCQLSALVLNFIVISVFCCAGIRNFLTG